MPIMWTALHRELGLPPRALTIADIENAISNRIVERSDLDWKQQPPVPDKREDFASDVAAMANSGGGTLVMGVREDSLTSAAIELLPVEIGDSARRSLWQWIAAIVRPRVASFEIEGIPDAPGSTSGVILINIRASSSAPHLIERNGKPTMRAPYRQGAATAYMTEVELSQAYARRFEIGRNVGSRHEEIIEHASVRVETPEELPWIIATAVPMEPLSSAFRTPLEHQQRMDIWQQADKWATRQAGHHEFARRPILSRLGGASIEQLRGPRSWFARQSSREEGMSSNLYQMLYDDGAIALGVRGQSRLIDQSATFQNQRVVSIVDVESLAADFFALVDAQSRGLGGLGPVNVRFGVYSFTTNDRKIAIFDRDEMEEEGFVRVRGSLLLRRVRDEQIDYEPDRGEWHRLRAAKTASSAIEAQFGVQTLRVFSEQAPAAVSTPENDASEDPDHSES